MKRKEADSKLLNVIQYGRDDVMWQLGIETSMTKDENLNTSEKLYRTQNRTYPPTTSTNREGRERGAIAYLFQATRVSCSV